MQSCREDVDLAIQRLTEIRAEKDGIRREPSPPAGRGEFNRCFAGQTDVGAGFNRAIDSSRPRVNLELRPLSRVEERRSDERTQLAEIQVDSDRVIRIDRTLARECLEANGI